MRLGRPGLGIALAVLGSATAAERPLVFKPPLAVPEVLAPFLDLVTPGKDAFQDERAAEELAGRLAELSERLRRDARAAEVASFLVSAGFRGARLRPLEAMPVATNAALRVERASRLSTDRTLDGRAFAQEWSLALQDFRKIDTAEFLVTAVDVKRETASAATDVRFDIVGSGQESSRVQQVGAWRLGWRRENGSWRVAEWSVTRSVQSRAARPVYTEVTQKAFGANESFRRQLGAPLDAWVATIDSGLMRDSNGHHGVSVGDADGDGRDDLYVSQPSGLPNRLYRAKGDGSFEDVTERAGLAVLDDTSQSLFADVDDDGDQDLVLTLPDGPALFRNDGSGRFARVEGAFRYQQALSGQPMSLAMADYDRDGFLDVYLCVYSFYYGAGEGKAGTPMPYHDAQNGPPSVLFRNDGQGRFTDVTREAGLEATNDRYHFAAAWADYDQDGWPDLAVANDFGRKNLYRNLGRRDGVVRFEDVSKAAGVEDHGAGMSAAWLDYDNDGRLDLYFGNMWSANGLRVTASPAFLPGAPEDVRALYRRHARGNTLLRNLGGGRFQDVTLEAGAEMGRWAWSSDALDFDSDGFEDLYVANGMLTRESGPQDLDGFFWRQVVARSPLARVTGTPYDDAWRAINQLLVQQSIASRQRNVFLRNDGRGRFDDVSGSVGLDLDQDGRSFAVFDADGDGDPDVVVLAARGAPQLRLFRNDYAGRGAVVAVRLTGKTGNRDAVGARVTVETDVLRRTRIVQAGSGFLSQHSRELLFGLGASRRVLQMTVEWPSGARQTFADVPLDQRLWIEEGGQPRREPLRAAPATPADAEPMAPAAAPSASWLYEPFPVPDLTLLSSLRGRPALLLLSSSESSESLAARAALERGAAALEGAGLGVRAVDLERAGEGIGKTLAIVYRHLFMNRQPLPLPTALLLDAEGRVVRVYRRRIDVAEIVRDAAGSDAPAAERLARAVPFAGTFHGSLGIRNYVPYGRELLDQGLESEAVVAFQRAAEGNPTAWTLYQLGTLLAKGRQPAQAKAAFERALALKPDLSEAHNDLGALLAESGDVTGAIERFRAALQTAPEYPDALNNLGYALLLTGRETEARALYAKALALQPEFPEASNNLGMILGRAGELERAEPHFRKALELRPDYGEAANNLALVLVARGDADAAIRLIEEFLKTTPQFEGGYLTLAKIYLGRDQRREGLAVLERLLQRNPAHTQAREILRQFQGGR